MTLFSDRATLISPPEGGAWFPAPDPDCLRGAFLSEATKTPSGSVSVHGCQSTAPPVTDDGSGVTVLRLPHTDWVAENSKVVYHSSGGQKSGTEVSQGPTPSEGSRVHLSCFFQLLVAPGALWLCPRHSSLCLCHLMALSSMYLCLLLFCLL